jgi:hypothetical protein
MSQYAQPLDAMHRLLMQAGETHWAAWIERAMREWRESRAVKHHLSAYGGMGSFNDISHLIASAAGPGARWDDYELVNEAPLISSLRS